MVAEYTDQCHRSGASGPLPHSLTRGGHECRTGGECGVCGGEGCVHE